MYTVKIKNPEALENACNNFTKVVIELYNEGKFDLSNVEDKPTHKKERKAV